MGWGKKTAHRALQAVEFFDNPKKTPDRARGLLFTDLLPDRRKHNVPFVFELFAVR
jgi:hypothetical protein